MRRRRLSRSSYRFGTKKKSIKPILVRVAFVLVCVALTAGAALLLGSYLDQKAQVAESLLQTSDKNGPETDKTELFPDKRPTTPDVLSENVCAAHIDVVGVTEEEVAENIRALGDVYNAVSVNVVSPEGNLVYLSDALMDYVRLDGTLVVRGNDGAEDGTDGDALPAIKSAISEATRLGMRKSAVFSASNLVLEESSMAQNDRTVDGILLGELYGFGFDEVIITSLVDSDDEITTELLKKIVAYLTSLREYSLDIDIGVMLPASVYLVPQSASFIKTLSEYADFLAISVTTDETEPSAAYSSVYDNCHSLKGNFSVYNIRGVISTNDEATASAAYAALCDLSAKSTQFSVYVANPSYESELPDVTPDMPTESGSVNENAVSKDKYTSNEDET